jgi:hypothetical protein
MKTNGKSCTLQTYLKDRTESHQFLRGGGGVRKPPSFVHKEYEHMLWHLRQRELQLCMLWNRGPVHEKSFNHAKSGSSLDNCCRSSTKHRGYIRHAIFCSPCASCSTSFWEEDRTALKHKWISWLSERLH